MGGHPNTTRNTRRTAGTTSRRLLYLCIAVTLLGSAAEGQVNLKLQAVSSSFAPRSPLEFQAWVVNESQDTIVVPCVFSRGILDPGVVSLYSQEQNKFMEWCGLSPSISCTPQIVLPNDKLGPILLYVEGFCNKGSDQVLSLPLGEYTFTYAILYHVLNIRDPYALEASTTIEVEGYTQEEMDLMGTEQFNTTSNGDAETARANVLRTLTTYSDRSMIRDEVLYDYIKYQVLKKYPTDSVIVSACLSLLIQYPHSYRWEQVVNKLFENNNMTKPYVKEILANSTADADGLRKWWLELILGHIEVTQEDRKAGKVE